MTKFTATVSAARAVEAISKVERRLPEGFKATGNVSLRSQRHLLYNVEVEMSEGTTEAQRDEVWVTLTSYGISPSEDLGSIWSHVEGVGC